MISVLLQGTLNATPVRRTSEAGKPFATAQVRAPTEDDAVLCGVIAFDKDAVESLLTLDKGDAVALSGTAKLSHWTSKDGTERTGLSVVAHKVMSNYVATKKRRAQGEADKPAPQGEWALAAETFR